MRSLEIVERILSGENYREVGRDLGMPTSTVRCVFRRTIRRALGPNRARYYADMSVESARTDRAFLLELVRHHSEQT